MGEEPPGDITEQQFTLILSGVAFANLKGQTGAAWRHETLLIRPALKDALFYVVNTYNFPLVMRDGRFGNKQFQVEQWAPFAALSAMFNEHESINSGFAMDAWRLAPLVEMTGWNDGQPVFDIFAGLEMDVAVRDSDAWLYRVSYHITLLGKVVFTYEG